MAIINHDSTRDEAGSRSILRVPEVLATIASRREGITFSELHDQLGLPRSSLHRLLKTLVQGRYLVRQASVYLIGPEAARLARIIENRTSTVEFPASARPIMEWLARETNESVILSSLSESMTETIYLDVIASEAPLRFTPPPGHRPPLYAVAAGKVILAFMPHAFQSDYLAKTNILPVTPFTSDRRSLAKILAQARKDTVVVDRQGHVLGASAVASPVFNPAGDVFCAISAAGPDHRIEAAMQHLKLSVLEAGKQLSKVLGYTNNYPPRLKSKTD